MSGPGLVDWATAERVARVAAGDGSDTPTAGVLGSAVAESTHAVERYTGLVPEQPLPEAEWVSRREWASINVRAMRDGLDPLEQSLAVGSGLPGPLSAAIGRGLGLVLGAQIGAFVGYGSRRVLGQYEFPILGPAREPRLLFVGTNVAEAQRELGAEPRTVLRWIALHEVTHAVHFGAAPWLREHLRGLATELIAGSSLQISPAEILATARRLAGSDPRRLLAELWSSDPLTLLTPPRSRRLLERTQAAMASVEGFAEHVMDAAAPTLGEQVGELRLAIDRRREERPPFARLLSWLLGFELKLRQYRDGKRFCDGVVELDGIDALNAAWRGPDTLPTLAELADPGAWLRRAALIEA